MRSLRTELLRQAHLQPIPPRLQTDGPPISRFRDRHPGHISSGVFHLAQVRLAAMASTRVDYGDLDSAVTSKDLNRNVIAMTTDNEI